MIEEKLKVNVNNHVHLTISLNIRFSVATPINGQNRLLVTHEPVEVQDFNK